MALAFELGLDPAADEAVRMLWAALEQVGVASLGSHLPLIRPHVSLLVSEDSGGLRACAARLRRQIRPCRVVLVGPGFFPADPPIMYLAASPSAGLLDMHRRVSRTLAAGSVDVWPHYREGEWMPHCTLSMGVPRDRLGEAVATCLAYPLPVVADLVEPRLTDSVTGDSAGL